MQRLKNTLFHPYVLVFLFCLAAIQGPSFSLMDNYDQSANVDCQTYMGIARFNFNQNPIRRYRPIVPLAAGAINYLFGKCFTKIRPVSFPGDFPIGLSFLIVNNLLIAVWGVVIYRYCRAFGVSSRAGLVGVLVMLTCRWTSYMAGTAMADSLYCLILGVALLGIQQKNTTLTILAIFIGPFAKEAFIFIAPVIFFFSHIGKLRLLLYFLLSGVIVFAFRYGYDHFAGFPPGVSIAADIGHVQTLQENTHKLLCFHGLYDVLSNFGLWIILPLSALFGTNAYWPALKQKTSLYMLFFLIAVLVHMLLSGSIERMFYLAMPLIAMVTAIAADETGKQYFVTGK